MVEEINDPKTIDGYVSMLLETYSKDTSVEVDLDNLTREQRVEAALYFDGINDMWSAIEIMVGRRIDAASPAAETYGFLMVAQKMKPDSSRKFYEGFPE
ncbi:MAG: hypothetical protein KJ906_01220 [Nanoarchaeota archaeon]|nr:hypothetical protein [Nanoarchaeota archaeon]